MIYDALGRVSRSYAPSAAGDTSRVLTLYTYNDLGQQTQGTVDMDGDEATTADQTTTTTEYDPVSGQRTLVRDALGHETSFAYDAMGRLVQTTYDDDSTTHSTYDEQGRLTSKTDQLGRVTTYEYDTQGRLTAVNLPAVSNPANSSQDLHPRYEYTYDDLGRQTAIAVNVALDDQGNVVTDHDGQAGSDAHVTAFTYDYLGRQLTRSLPLVDGESEPATETSVYETVDGSGSRLAYSVDFQGRLTYNVYEDALTPAFGRLTAQYYFASLAAFTAWQADPENAEKKRCQLSLITR